MAGGRKKSPKRKAVDPSPKKKSKKHPINLPLMTAEEAAASRASGRGKNWIWATGVNVVSQMVIEYLLSADEVRLDDRQVFVNRHEEQFFVAAFHFPSRGKARQIKFTVPVDGLLQSTASELTTDEAEYLRRQGRLPAPDPGFMDQAAADFEQMLVNFFYAALPMLAYSASRIAELNIERSLTSAFSEETHLPIEPFAHDLENPREEYIVNRSHGWP